MKKVTIQQIADRVGMSKFAVSQALSGKPGVSSENREKIIQTATLLGYFSQKHIRMKQRPGAHAAYINELAKKNGESKNTVIVVVQNVRFQTRENGYWGQIIDGVTSTLERNGIGVMMVTENQSDSLLQVINLDGVLGLIAIGHVSSRILLEISNAGIPFVLVDHEDPMLPCDTVFMNNFDCMRKVTAHLIGIGHRDMRFVGNPKYSRSFLDRWLGFSMTAEELGLPRPSEQEIVADFQSGDDYAYIGDKLRSLHAAGRLPTAFICANDFWAMRVIEVLHELRVNVPGDVSVTGFDNIGEARASDPPLATIDVPKEAMGTRAVEILLRRSADMSQPFEKTLLFGEFLLRQSIQPL